MNNLISFAGKLLGKQEVSPIPEDLKHETKSLDGETNKNVKLLKLDEIETDPEISSIFSIQEKTLELIKTSMQTGYDLSQPIVVWFCDDKYIVIDGHSRLRAASEVGIREIPAYVKEFPEGRQEAIQYTFARQAERRNLTDQEILNAVKLLPKKQVRDGSGRSVERLSKELGVSASTLVHAKTVREKAEPEVLEKIKEGKTTINRAYQEIKASKQKLKADEEPPKNDICPDLPAAEADNITPICNDDMESPHEIQEHKKAITASIEDILRLLAEYGEISAINLILDKYPNSVSAETLADLNPQKIRANLT